MKIETSVELGDRGLTECSWGHLAAFLANFKTLAAAYRCLLLPFSSAAKIALFGSVCSLFSPLFVRGLTDGGDVTVVHLSVVTVLLLPDI